MKESDYQYLSRYNANALDQENIDYNSALETLGYISTYNDGTIESITAEGRKALSEYERSQDEVRKQSAENECKEVQRLKDRADDRRFNARMSIINGIVCGTTGVLLTLLVEHVILPLFK